MGEKAAAYVRVSTQEQKEEGSHEDQRHAINEWAERNDFEVEFFEDIGISGQSDTREDYDELMDFYEEYDAVVVRELSRFGRDPVTVLQDVEQIIDSDTDFISITEDFDTSTAMGKAFVRLVAVINGMYADLRREQALRAVERRREEGLPVGRPKKLDESLLADVYDLRRKGVSYKGIARIMEGEPEGPDEISRETIRRYCKEAGVEPEQR